MSTENSISVAKVQVLHLDPIKSRLGNKWPRLSDLVHRLFEKSLRKVQKPGDQFLLLDELSYIATFEGLTPDQTILACASVSKEVCELLFGKCSEQVSVRGLVANVSPSALHPIEDGLYLSSLLEATGTELLVAATSRSPRATVRSTENNERPRQVSWWGKVQSIADGLGYRAGLVPLWDVSKHQSSILLFSFAKRCGRRCLNARGLMVGASETAIVDAEIAVLMFAADYSNRMSETHQQGAIAIGISYESLIGLSTRIKIVTAIKKSQIGAICPLLLIVDEVPRGAPQGMLAELTAMLSLPKVRIMLKYMSPPNANGGDLRLGATGIGAALPIEIGDERSSMLIGKIAGLAASQKAAPFLLDLDDANKVQSAVRLGIKLLAGPILDGDVLYQGSGGLAKLPLQMSDEARTFNLAAEVHNPTEAAAQMLPMVEPMLGTADN